MSLFPSRRPAPPAAAHSLPAPAQQTFPPAEPPPAARSAEPVSLTWPAAAVVITFLVLATVLFALGHPAAAVIGLLGGAAAVAIEVIRRITGRS